MDKKSAAITVHLPVEMMREFRDLAELEALSASEKGYQIISEYVTERRAYYQSMQRVFGLRENQENSGIGSDD